MLEVYVEPRRTVNFKQAVVEAIENGEYESLADDIRDCFSEDQIEEIQEVLESGDIEETIDDIITEWSGDNLEELMEGIDIAFSSSSIELHFEDDDIDLGSEDAIKGDDLDDDFEEQEGGYEQDETKSDQIDEDENDEGEEDENEDEDEDDDDDDLF